ncbi:DUF3971 domain-containing protein [Agrobacterium tumefaciens]|uniref:YhdP family protein n=1 Tax=Agrobacterium tumefaciens TaxID=358 RepID=UPI00287EBE92|nr:DUF3971 domain-containing protein [Agrobacterium tumefaciens]MDS7597301.1 DUF3971 domain-containing protein [Agrobacterium tumefaciens]
MAEIRGERVKFGKQDIVPLHGLPSAQAEDPIIVHCPAPRSLLRTFSKIFAALFVLAFLSIGGIILSVETGAIDKTLSQQAQQTLEKALGPNYSARIGSSAIRFSTGLRLALVARDVDIIDTASGQHMSRAQAIGMALDPIALLGGRVSVQSLEANGLELDTTLLPKGNGFDLSAVTVDAIPDALQSAFGELDNVAKAFRISGTEEITIADVAVRLPPTTEGKLRTIQLQELSLSPDAEGGYSIDGEAIFNNEIASLSLRTSGTGGAIEGFEARLDGFDVGPLLEKYDPQGNLHEGLNVKVGVNIVAHRGADGRDPDLAVSVGVGNGKLLLAGEEQVVTGGAVHARYDFTSGTLALENSRLEFGHTVLPVAGEIRDTDQGFSFALRADNAMASAEASGEAPVPFNLKADGQYSVATRQLDVPSLYVSGPLGDMAGSLKIRFGEGSPEISFGGQIPKMEATAVKQLWPFWMAHKPRDWVVSNLFGGTVTNGSIAVFIPQGRMCGPGCPLVLGKSEMQIRFDIADTRLNTTGTIPPLRDADAHFELVGERIDVNIERATSYFPSSRSLSLESSRFSIASVYDKPLLADLDLNIAGSADAVAELATLHPINALKDTDFKPEDFSGDVRAHAKLVVGLLTSQQPPPPVWSADLNLKGLALARPFAGRDVTGVDGTMTLNDGELVLQGKGRIDDVPMDISLTEPIRKNTDVARQLSLKASLNESQVAKLAPELSSVLGGTTVLEIDGADPKRQNVKLDLTRASMVLPGIGWSKGIGVPANAAFTMEAVDGRTAISDFSLDGDGFGAAGDMAFNKNGLISADLSRLKLSSSDDYAISVVASKNSYIVTANGKSADIRPLISRLRNPSAGGDGTARSQPSLAIKAQLDKVYGFNGEVLSNVNADVNLLDGKVRSVDVRGVTGNGQAVVAQTTNKGASGTITLTSSDAGSLARFADIYTRIRGGLVNLSLTTNNGSAWSGSLDMRNFSVVNEAKLQDIVATPTGEDGRSLNTAVRRNIDVSSEKFQRGFARIVYVNGAVAVENGVVRGEQIGATFQGLLKDQNGRMEMTGTFMPAYGLNRLFGELPFIGIFLGNGRDRGLLGITFKLSGPVNQPTLAINPLSLIAPGVFRQIFEFQ